MVLPLQDRPVAAERREALERREREAAERAAQAARPAPRPPAEKAPEPRPEPRPGPRGKGGKQMEKWVCLKMRYTPNYSHLVGIMIINHWV